MARVLRAEEAVRPVTGARLLRVWVQGEAGPAGEAVLDEAALDASPRGYLVARVRRIGAVAEPAAAQQQPTQPLQSQPAPQAQLAQRGEAKPVLVVCVVGLAHANGVLDRCAEALSDQA